MGKFLRDRAAARHELSLRRARRSFPDFCAYVFGQPLAEHHRRWVEIIELHNRSVILAPVEHGKTSILSVAYPLWVLANNPNARIALISATHNLAIRPLAALKETIVASSRLKGVCPLLRPAAGARAKWADDEILVERSLTSKDPSLLAIGVFGPLLGARLDLVIVDDAVSFENSLTATQRAKVIGWFKSTVVGRVVSGGRIIVAGTPWHPDDLLHELERSGEYAVRRDPAMNDAGDPLWPDVWPVPRLEQRRREIGEIEFSRQMLLKVLSDATSRFRAEWFEHAFRAAADAQVALADSYHGPHPTFTGVDLGVGLTDKHDESAIFTIALLPDGRRRVLNVDAGRWQAPELIDRLKNTHRRYRSRLRVESNAAQAYIGQFLQADGIPVEAHFTGRNRNDPVLGIEGLAVEFERGQWIVPDAPATRTWIREMLAFNPAGHAGDRLVAAWLAREAARAATIRQPLPLAFLRTDDRITFGADGPVVARPAEFPEDAWTDAVAWFR